MRVLITGGAGFSASHIVDKYLESGHYTWYRKWERGKALIYSLTNGSIIGGSSTP